jgi:Lon protease-like protein
VRFRVVGEVSREPYRTARVVADLERKPALEIAWGQREWLVDLAREYLRYLPDETPVPELETVALDALTNALIMSLNFEIEDKQRLLEIGDIVRRSEEVGSELRNRIESLHFLAPYRRSGDPSKN